jgi:hypothetical protein
MVRVAVKYGLSTVFLVKYDLGRRGQAERHAVVDGAVGVIIMNTLTIQYKYKRVFK